MIDGIWLPAGIGYALNTTPPRRLFALMLGFVPAAFGIEEESDTQNARTSASVLPLKVFSKQEEQITLVHFAHPSHEAMSPGPPAPYPAPPRWRSPAVFPWHSPESNSDPPLGRKEIQPCGGSHHDRLARRHGSPRRLMAPTLPGGTSPAWKSFPALLRAIASQPLRRDGAAGAQPANTRNRSRFPRLCPRQLIRPEPQCPHLRCSVLREPQHRRCWPPIEAGFLLLRFWLLRFCPLDPSQL